MSHHKHHNRYIEIIKPNSDSKFWRVVVLGIAIMILWLTHMIWVALALALWAFILFIVARFIIRLKQRYYICPLTLDGNALPKQYLVPLSSLQYPLPMGVRVRGLYGIVLRATVVKGSTPLAITLLNGCCVMPVDITGIRVDILFAGVITAAWVYINYQISMNSLGLMFQEKTRKN